MRLLQTPPPPYYAVIFSSLLSDHPEGYADTAQRMEELAKEQAGFLGMESARDDMGITISYWKDLAAIQVWKQQVEHRLAQKIGKERWYRQYQVRIAKVERAYGFEQE